MSKRAKLLLGAATLWPIIYGFVFVTGVFYLSMRHEFIEVPVFYANVLLIFHIFTVCLMMGLFGYYYCNTFSNPAVPEEQRGHWAMAIIFSNAAVMPIYWYLYIWRPHCRTDEPIKPDAPVCPDENKLDTESPASREGIQAVRPKYSVEREPIKPDGVRADGPRAVAGVCTQTPAIPPT